MARTSKKKALPPADDAAALARRAEVQDPASAADLLSDQSATTIVDVLPRVRPGVAQDILAELSAPRQSRVFSLAPGAVAEQWQVNQAYGEDAVGWLMEPPLAVFTPGMTVDRKSTRLNSSHMSISYAVFCLKKKKEKKE